MFMHLMKFPLAPINIPPFKSSFLKFLIDDRKVVQEAYNIILHDDRLLNMQYYRPGRHTSENTLGGYSDLDEEFNIEEGISLSFKNKKKAKRDALEYYISMLLKAYSEAPLIKQQMNLRKKRLSKKVENLSTTEIPIEGMCLAIDVFNETYDGCNLDSLCPHNRIKLRIFFMNCLLVMLDLKLDSYEGARDLLLDSWPVVINLPKSGSECECAKAGVLQDHKILFNFKALNLLTDLRIETISRVLRHMHENKIDGQLKMWFQLADIIYSKYCQIVPDHLRNQRIENRYTQILDIHFEWLHLNNLSFVQYYIKRYFERAIKMPEYCPNLFSMLCFYSIMYARLNRMPESMHLITCAFLALQILTKRFPNDPQLAIFNSLTELAVTWHGVYVLTYGHPCDCFTPLDHFSQPELPLKLSISNDPVLKSIMIHQNLNIFLTQRLDFEQAKIIYDRTLHSCNETLKGMSNTYTLHLELNLLYVARAQMNQQLAHYSPSHNNFLLLMRQFASCLQELFEAIRFLQPEQVETKRELYFLLAQSYCRVAMRYSNFYNCIQPLPISDVCEPEEVKRENQSKIALKGFNSAFLALERFPIIAINLNPYCDKRDLLQIICLKFIVIRSLTWIQEPQITEIVQRIGQPKNYVKNSLQQLDLFSKVSPNWKYCIDQSRKQFLGPIESYKSFLE